VVRRRVEPSSPLGVPREGKVRTSTARVVEGIEERSRRVGHLRSRLHRAARNIPTMLPPAWVVEANEVQFLMALGRAGGGEEREDGEVTWTIGGSPIAYHNCVVRAELSGARVDAVIAQSQYLMLAKGVPGSWHVGPSMYPSDLGEHLVAHGFEGGAEPGMAVELADLASIDEPPGVQLERVTSDTALADYQHVLSLSFGEGPPEAEWVCAMYARIGLGDKVPWRHFIARLDGQAVATASTFFAVGAAGLYFVSTLPELRGRGIGTAISRAALADAREIGYRVGVLGSSPMGQHVYERLGFREVCEVGVYEWSPDP
jgi:GNAT superfamily N-acetyltransferase